MTQNQTIAQSPTHQPLQPSYILRGHTAQVHSVLFLHNNLRLLSGDADGWVVLWDVPIKRPVAVWRAHRSTILGLGSWGESKVITLVNYLSQGLLFNVADVDPAAMEGTASFACGNLKKTTIRLTRKYYLWMTLLRTARSLCYYTP